jgi:hypothetical protein
MSERDNSGSTKAEPTDLVVSDIYGAETPNEAHWDEPALPADDFADTEEDDDDIVPVQKKSRVGLIVAALLGLLGLGGAGAYVLLSRTTPAPYELSEQGTTPSTMAAPTTSSIDMAAAIPAPIETAPAATAAPSTPADSLAAPVAPAMPDNETPSALAAGAAPLALPKLDGVVAPVMEKVNDTAATAAAKVSDALDAALPKTPTPPADLALPTPTPPIAPAANTIATTITDAATATGKAADKAMQAVSGAAGALAGAAVSSVTTANKTPAPVALAVATAAAPVASVTMPDKPKPAPLLAPTPPQPVQIVEQGQVNLQPTTPAPTLPAGSMAAILQAQTEAKPAAAHADGHDAKPHKPAGVSKPAPAKVEQPIAAVTPAPLKKPDVTATPEPTVEKTAAQPSQTAKIAEPEAKPVAQYKPKPKAPAKQPAPKAIAPAPKAIAVASSAPYVLQAAIAGQAWLAAKETPDELRSVSVGDTVVGLGKITAIEQQDNVWTVVGTKGSLR